MKLLASILLAAGVVGMASAAQALPVAPTAAPTSAITEIGWRCGPGWHVNRWGTCVPNRHFYRPRNYWAPPRFYGPRHHHWRQDRWHNHRHWRRW